MNLHDLDNIYKDIVEESGVLSNLNHRRISGNAQMSINSEPAFTEITKFKKNIEEKITPNIIDNSDDPILTERVYNDFYKLAKNGDIAGANELLQKCIKECKK